MINFLRRSLSLEIENFISHITSIVGSLPVSSFSKSAFVQCRKKIKPEVFKHLSNLLIEEFYTDNDASIKLWRNFRLLAVDGSTIRLPDTKELSSEYGKSKNQTKTHVVQARVSVLYDVLNKYVIDGSLSPLDTGEKSLAKQHLSQAKKGDLIIYDRGYPSFELVYEHYQKKLNFLMRFSERYESRSQND